MLSIPIKIAQSEILDYNNPDCVKNASLAPEAKDNYVDCNTPKNIADNKTRCCKIDGENGCCGNSTE